MAAVLTCVGVAGALSVALDDPTQVATSGTRACRTLAAAMFAAAGVLGIARWRLRSDPANALVGLAYLILGVVAVPLTGLVRTMTADSPDSMLPGLCRGSTSLLALALVALALRGTVFGERPNLATVTVRTGIGVGLLSVAALSTAACPWPFLHAAPWAQAAVSVLVSGCWVGMGLHAHGLADRVGWAGRATPLLAAMGVAEGLRGIAVGAADPDTWLLAAAALTASVATIVAYCGLVDLGAATHLQHERLEEASEALALAEGVASRGDAWREELTHDARNALTGLRGALFTLEKYDGKLDPTMTERLRSAAMDELSHLQRMIERPSTTEPVEFDVAEVVRSVTDARRATGLTISSGLRSVRVVGDPRDLARVLQNLLVNAQVHGRGRGVRVDIASDGRHVEICVSDRGPGLSPAVAATLFERGSRHPGSPGSGLGLYVSRTLMREQGGDLELRDRECGAEFVLRLPSAQAAPAPVVLPQPRHVDGRGFVTAQATAW